jgi:probable HAF family extracellular repeat protein
VPAAINDAGQVVGSLIVNSVSHAFIWSPTTGLEDLGTLPGDTESGATGVNVNGDIAGYSRPLAGNARAIRWSRGNGMTEIGGLPYTCLGTWANDINAAGDIVGECLVDRYQIIYRPFRWTDAKGMEDLGTLDSDLGGVANAINDSGVIAGISNSASYYDDSRAVLWAGPGKAVQVGECAEGWCGTYASAINNNGDVAGSAYGSAFVRWHDGTMRDIGGIAGALYSIAIGINQAGEIVGMSWLASEKRNRSFIWTASGGIRELTLPGKTEFVVTGINNNGEIIGYAR